MTQVAKPRNDAWREALKIISRCPVCSTIYNQEDARSFAYEEKAALVHLTCRHCQGFFLAMVVKLGVGLSSVGMVTDLNYIDLKRLHAAGTIEIDELIEGAVSIKNPDFINKIVNY
ncbi:MAG: hypothetical protein Q7K39_00500 [Candidatus Magasanikbacteria bacterium]|nr:hypothetical protein [Candidatus Magasanikbacteria bacterium]